MKTSAMKMRAGVYIKNRPYQKIRSVFIEIVSEMRVELTRPHGHYPLKVACLPIPPPGLESAKSSALSEKRGSNPRPRPWQGRALPTELFSHILMCFCYSDYSRFLNCSAKVRLISDTCKFLSIFF